MALASFPAPCPSPARLAAEAAPVTTAGPALAPQVEVVATKVARAPMAPAAAPLVAQVGPTRPSRLGLAAGGVRAVAGALVPAAEAVLKDVAGVGPPHEGVVRSGRPVGKGRAGRTRAPGQAVVPVGVATAGVAGPTTKGGALAGTRIAQVVVASGPRLLPTEGVGATSAPPRVLPARRVPCSTGRHEVRNLCAEKF